MRERMFATLGIWAAIAISIDRLLNALSYTVTPLLEPAQVGADGVMQMFPQYNYETVYVGGFTQFAIFVIIFMALACATGATIAIWNAAQATHERAAASIRESHKTKRDRETRVRRLLSQMDEDDLAALEEQHISDDGEQMTVAELMQQKRGK